MGLARGGGPGVGGIEVPKCVDASFDYECILSHAVVGID